MSKPPKIINILRCSFIVYCLVAVLLGAWDVMSPWSSLTPSQRVSLSHKAAADDVDLGQWLLPGLAMKTNFAQTLTWWHGTWAGQVPFWRPLTSYALWAEYRIFSPNRFDRWFWVSAASHLIFAALLFAFTRRLTHRVTVAASATLIFAGSPLLSPFAWVGEHLNASWFPVLGFESFPPAVVALDSWKNQPEAWTGALTLAAMTLALSRRWAWCLVCAGLSICFKESGWLTFPLVGLALWADGGLRAIPRRVVVAGSLMAAALIVLRATSGWSVFYGYHFGSNGHWMVRYLGAIGGPYLDRLSWIPSALPALYGTVLFLLTRIARRVRFLALFAAAICAGLAFSELLAIHYGQPLAVGATMLLMWKTGFHNVALALVWLLGATTLWKRYSHRQVLAIVLMGFVAAIPIAAAAQVQEHVMYLSYAFNSVLLAAALTAIARASPFHSALRRMSRQTGAAAALPAPPFSTMQANE